MDDNRLQMGFRDDSLVEEARDEFENKVENIKEDIASKYGVEKNKLDPEKND